MSADSENPAAAPPRERIAKRLARAGVASRRDAEQMIAEGRVAVNGRVISSPALDVGAHDAITLDGQPLPAPEPTRLWRYHKPSGLVTSARDEKGRPTIHDHLPADLPRVMPVGRLDLTSEGLLLLTNDGELKRRLELPTTGWLRKYRVRVKGTPDEAALEPLRRGLEVAGERFAPMTVSLDRVQGANAWLTVGLREGRNREVRRAMEAIGLIVNRLIRISYGPFQLGDLAPGAVDEVRRKVLREQLGLTEPAADAPKPKGTKVGGRKPGRARTGPTKPTDDKRRPAGPATAKPGTTPKALGLKPDPGKPGPRKPGPGKPDPRKPGPGAPGRRPGGGSSPVPSARPGPRRPSGRSRPPRG